MKWPKSWPEVRGHSDSFDTDPGIIKQNPNSHDRDLILPEPRFPLNGGPLMPPDFPNNRGFDRPSPDFHGDPGFSKLLPDFPDDWAFWKTEPRFPNNRGFNKPSSPSLNFHDDPGFISKPNDPGDFESRLRELAAQYEKIRKSAEDRYANGYNDTFHGDAADYAAAYAAAQNRLISAAKSLLGDIEAQRGTYGDEWAADAARSVSSRLAQIIEHYDTAKKDAAYWSRFDGAADYGAQMFSSGAENGDDFRRMTEVKLQDQKVLDPASLSMYTDLQDAPVESISSMGQTSDVRLGQVIKLSNGEFTLDKKESKGYTVVFVGEFAGTHKSTTGFFLR